MYDQGLGMFGQLPNRNRFRSEKGLLAENHQIQAVVMNKKVSAYDLGVWELYVHEKDAEQAKQALAWD